MIHFDFLVNSEFIPETEHKIWLNTVIRNEHKIPGEITYIFCNDDYMISQNVKFLNHDTYTDIITFSENSGDVVSGSILISIDRILDNANKFSKTYIEEFLRVLVHGILHLCGYKDKTKEEEQIMRTKENESLKLLENFL